MDKDRFKFRAWWVKDDGEDIVPMMVDNSHIFNYVDPLRPIEDGDIIVMQYTGLKDKNGKEIYEGDIVAAFNFIDKNFRHEVIFKNGAFGYTSQFLSGFIPYAGNDNFKWSNGKSDKIEVIGNIYENPELMEG
jgi:uncharacterized phage protein (TIGR01671 family)